MPGIRFPDARCGPVVHDAAIPRKFRGVGLGFFEPVDGGIHGGGVHAGGEHGPVILFIEGHEPVERVAADKRRPEQLVEAEMTARFDQQLFREVREVDAPVLVYGAPVAFQQFQELLLVRGGAAQVDDGHAPFAGSEAGVVVDARFAG